MATGRRPPSLSARRPSSATPSPPLPSVQWTACCEETAGASARQGARADRAPAADVREVRGKLVDGGFAPAEANEAVERLQDSGALDDAASRPLPARALGAARPGASPAGRGPPAARPSSARSRSARGARSSAPAISIPRPSSPRRRSGGCGPTAGGSTGSGTLECIMRCSAPASSQGPSKPRSRDTAPTARTDPRPAPPAAPDLRHHGEDRRS